MKMNSPLGDLYVTINEDENGRPFEVFCTLGKAGGAAMADAEAMGRLMSLALRSGIPIRQVKDQFAASRATGPSAWARTRCSRCPTRWVRPSSATSRRRRASRRRCRSRSGCPRARRSRSRSTMHRRRELFDMGTCPECGTGHLAFEEGCKKCHVCGYSECG
jgi:ribonucleoside-diphosphate reductase alpha chain